jgi:hypothetical protein
MVATFAIETVLLLYVLFRYKRTPVVWLSVAILAGLATFQLAEYNVCQGAVGMIWAQIGLVAITLLPPLGLHLVMHVAGRISRTLLVAAYGSAVAFIVVFLFAAQGISAQECLGNYIIFTLVPWVVWPYAAFYYGWLLVSGGYAWHASHSIKSKWQRRALYALIVGALTFLIPTAIVNLLDRATIAGIPSIMCGFAVLFAIILVGFVLPWYHYKSPTHRKGK